ncbi:ferredoxin [Spiractinospora alimapuensis]|uniref:ferredoxin n=1 Tax=Spiractinospora alimapuensis TaxID=2820884 RepID=UPI001F1EE59D|nr:ferredoxin [Spiractinospora alimapuensis]QVQ52209.1 ferredoxin [Spiractinospora alimapuensis]
MRLRTDREVCVGAGMCALTAPEVFDQDTEHGRVVLRTEEPPTDSQLAARRAADLCPAGAITVAPS